MISKRGLSILSNLNLSWNRLSGNIRDNIGSMKLMESLDLWSNNFSREIPPSLSDLTYLSYLDLSYNNLNGMIPSGRQLDTLYTENPSMYSKNNDVKEEVYITPSTTRVLLHHSPN
jgi:hypothetical protein